MNETPTWEESTPVDTATAEAPRWEDSTPLDTPHWDDSTPIGEATSDTPETDSALKQFSKKEAAFEQKFTPEWVQNLEGALTELGGGIPGMVGQTAQAAYQGAKFTVGGPQERTRVAAEILTQATQMGQQLASDVQHPVGSKEWWRGALQMGMMATPALEWLRPARIPLRTTEPYVPPTTPPIQRPGTISADVGRAMQGPGWETRFQLVPEPKPTVEAAPSIEQTLAGAPAEPSINIETGQPFYPEIGTRLGVPSETARIGGEPDASRIPSAASVPELEVRPQVGQETPLRQPGETPPVQEPVSPGAPVAPETPSTDEKIALAAIKTPPVEERVQPGEFKEKGYTAVPTPITAEIGGPSIRAVSERPIETPPPGTIRGWEQATAHGENWLNRGGDINKVVTDFRRTGKVNELEMGKMNAYLNRLQSVTNKAGDALRTRPNDPKLQQAYQQAVAAEQVFTEAYKPMHTVASGSLAALQGHVPLTEEAAASHTGLSRRFQEFMGRPMQPEEVVKAEKLSKQMEKANGEYKQANQELYKRLDTEYGRLKTTRKAPPTLEDLGKIFGETLDEVCDV